MDLNTLFGYKGKTVVVSGAFSGMGRAAARLLSELGADIYAICRRNGRHNTLDFPVKEILYCDFGDKKDLDALAIQLPEHIQSVFLCHGIALNGTGGEENSNTLEVQKVNFLGSKYLLGKILPKIKDRGSVTIISSTGGYGWQDNIENCMAVINAGSYEATMAWYKSHPEAIRSGYVFSKQCLCAYVKSHVHEPEYIDRKIRLNCVNPGNTLTGLTEDFNKYTSPAGNEAEGKAMIEALFLDSWDGYWAQPEDIGYPLVAIGSQLFSYMSGQIIYFDYGVSSTWEFGEIEP